MNGHAIGLGKEVSSALYLERFYHLVSLSKASVKELKGVECDENMNINISGK